MAEVQVQAAWFHECVKIFPLTEEWELKLPSEWGRWASSKEMDGRLIKHPISEVSSKEVPEKIYCFQYDDEAWLRRVLEIQVKTHPCYGAVALKAEYRSLECNGNPSVTQYTAKNGQDELFIYTSILYYVPGVKQTARESHDFILLQEDGTLIFPNGGEIGVGTPRGRWHKPGVVSLSSQGGTLFDVPYRVV